MIHGLPKADLLSGSKDETDREASQAVLTLCNYTVGLSIPDSDVSTAFRQPKRGKEKFRPVLVKFVTIRARKLVYAARLLLNKTLVYINEHLTPTNAQVYSKARRIVKDGKTASTWTAGGITFVRMTDEPGIKPMRLSSSGNLVKLLHPPTGSSA